VALRRTWSQLWQTNVCCELCFVNLHNLCSLMSNQVHNTQNSLCYRSMVGQNGIITILKLDFASFAV